MAGVVLSIRGDEEMKRLVRKLKEVPQGFERAMNRAVNRTAQASLSMMAKGITKEVKLNVTQKEVRKLLKVRKSTFKTLTATVEARGRRALGLFKYGARPRTPEARKPKVGASVEVKKGSRRTLASAFVARMRSGHVGLFQRIPGSKMRKKNKEAIVEKYGPNIMAYMDPDQPFMRSIQGKLNDRLRREAEHEVKYLLDKAGIGRGP